MQWQTSTALSLLALLVLALAASVASAATVSGGKASGPPKRVRREVRSLTKRQWKRVVNAFHILKIIPGDEGELLYGPAYRSYDAMVAKHAVAALDVNGDQGHFSPVFSVFHRAWTLELENALLAVDPLILGLPYWDFSLDMLNTPSYPTVFSAEYFGSNGDPEQGYAVVDGPFSYWPIARDTLNFGLNWSSPYGYLRHPVSVNPSPFLCRRIGSLCGRYFEFGDPNSYRLCSALGPDISQFRECTDPTLHGPAHLRLGGSWKRTSQRNAKDSQNCAEWYGLIQPSVDPNDPSARADPNLQSLGSFVSAHSSGCIVCDKTDFVKCGPRDNPDRCMCSLASPQPNSCGPLWTGLIDAELSGNAKSDYRVTLAPPKEIQIIGDFVDAACSPNDPIFGFHHSNLDRVFFNWAAQFEPKSLAQLKYFKYPVTGYGYGSNLDDDLNPQWPFFDLVPGFKPSGTDGCYTVRDVLEATFPSRLCPYTYEQARYPLVVNPPGSAGSSGSGSGPTSSSTGGSSGSSSGGSVNGAISRKLDIPLGDAILEEESHFAAQSTDNEGLAVVVLVVIPLTLAALLSSWRNRAQQQHQQQQQQPVRVAKEDK